MVRMSLCAVLAFAVALPAGGDDKIGKEVASAILKKVKAEIDKKQGFHVKQLLKFPSSHNTKDMTAEGISKKDFAAFSGDADIYCKQVKTVVKDGSGKFVDPSTLTGADQVLPFCIQNPSQILGQIYALGVAAKWTGEEKLEEIDCKILETKADPNLCLNQIKQYYKVVPMPASAGGDITVYNKKDKSTSTYKVWVGKEDLLVHKIEWLLKMAVDQAAAGGPQFKMPESINAQWTLEFSQYDEELDVEIPAEIQKQFGIKK